MNRLTPIFIAGAIAISAGLAIAQSQMNHDAPMQGHDMSGMTMPGMDMSATDSPSTTAYMEAMDRMHSEPRRVCRRLQLLSRMEHHEQDDEQVFP